MTKSNEKEKQYVIIYPIRYDDIIESGEYRVLGPINEDWIKADLPHWMKRDHVFENELLKVELYMPLEKFDEHIVHKGGVNKTKEIVDLFLKMNNECKPKDVPSLRSLAAKTLAKDLHFFKPEMATEEAKEAVEEAKEAENEAVGQLKK
ncbi:hypothetical protein [Legionella fallonii]|uniref:Uncharacterized protein n=1 Tax=Legionella fallonii LLAP-10 TaxID=1212491 RepID=A0A098G8C7_9GAMM|nr:hypothetical protein [Legionella fallonii]CEG57725.1 protein of unknown function [Legionella fallonii LLAP-10]